MGAVGRVGKRTNADVTNVVKPRDAEEGIRLGITSTSMFFENGRLLWRVLPLEDFVQVIEELSRSSLAKENANHKSESHVLFNVE